MHVCVYMRVGTSRQMEFYAMLLRHSSTYRRAYVQYFEAIAIKYIAL